MKASFDSVSIGDMAVFDRLVDRGFWFFFDQDKRQVLYGRGKVVLGAACDESELVLDEFGVAWA